jgi:hypothetical protein
MEGTPGRLNTPEEESVALVRDYQSSGRPSKAKEVLGILLEQFQKGTPIASQDELLQVAFGTEERPDDNGVSALRSLVSRIRVELERIYRERRSDDRRIPRIILSTGKDGSYSLQFAPHPASATNFSGIFFADQDPLRCFWEPHINCPDDQRQIQTSDRIFVRLGDDYYFRDVSDPSGANWNGFIHRIEEYLDRPKPHKLRDEKEIEPLQKALRNACSQAIANFLGHSECAEKVEEFLTTKLCPKRSRHYVSAGESVGETYIAQLFTQFQKPLIFGNQPDVLADRGDANIIQVGKPRHTYAMTDRLNALPITLSTTKLQCRKHSKFHAIGEIPEAGLPEEPGTHVEESSFTPTSGPFTKYVIVTRCRNRNPSNVITNIVANHGRATEAVCEFLVREERVRNFLKAQSWNDAVPPYFQLVFAVKLVRHPTKQRAIGETVQFRFGGFWEDPNIDFTYDEVSGGREPDVP